MGKGEGMSFTMEDPFPLRDQRKKEDRRQERNGKARLVLKSAWLSGPFKPA